MFIITVTMAEKIFPYSHKSDNELMPKKICARKQFVWTENKHKSENLITRHGNITINPIVTVLNFD
jgi:hypothetical protein